MYDSYIYMIINHTIILVLMNNHKIGILVLTNIIY